MYSAYICLHAPTQTKCKCINRRDCNTGMQMCVRTQQGTYQVPKQVSRSQDQRRRKLRLSVLCSRVIRHPERIQKHFWFEKRHSGTFMCKHNFVCVCVCVAVRCMAASRCAVKRHKASTQSFCWWPENIQGSTLSVSTVLHNRRQFPRCHICLLFICLFGQLRQGCVQSHVDPSSSQKIKSSKVAVVWLACWAT